MGLNVKPEVIFSAAVFLLTFSLIMTACAPAPPPPATTTPIIAATQPFQPTLTPRPSPTPTQPPLGSAGNPIRIGFVLQPENTAAVNAAEDIAFFLANDTGMTVESLIYPDNQSLVTAIQTGDLDLFWLDALTYIALNWDGAAKVLLVSNQLGVYAYGVQFLAHEQRGFTPYYNPDTGENLGDPISALQQFAGTRPCFLHPQSLPGYLVPMGLLENTSTPTLDPIFVYSYSAIVRALYVQGICDFGVSYALIGDARTGSDIVQDLPDAQNAIRIIWQSDGIIPNLNLSSSSDLPLNLQVILQESFLNLANSADGSALLSAALKSDIADLKIVQDSFYNSLRAIIVDLNVDLQDFLSQNP